MNECISKLEEATKKTGEGCLAGASWGSFAHYQAWRFCGGQGLKDETLKVQEVERPWNWIKGMLQKAEYIGLMVNTGCDTVFAMFVALCDEHDQMMIVKQAKGLKQVIVCGMRQEFKWKNKVFFIV